MRDTPAPPRSGIWRRTDQAAIAGLLLFALVAMAIYWVAHGGTAGRLIEIDRAAPLAAHFQVDINSAEWTELLVLPEIGPALAKRIVENRRNSGPFTSVDDLDRVPGIGPKTLERLRPYLRPINAPSGLTVRTE